MGKNIRIGTRDSQLAAWQANQVRHLLQQEGYSAELVYIKSEGDIDLVTPLYEMGVQGVFTRSLDSALLNKRIDIAVHSMKDVPTVLPAGIVHAAVLERASYKDLLVHKGETGFLDDHASSAVIATSSIRRKAQWLHRYPLHRMENLRGNVNTRLRKITEQEWNGAIFAAAGLERIGLRPANSIELDWMLPAPAQGAIMVVGRENDEFVLEACSGLDHPVTALCTKTERDFLRALLGGCSTPVSALATIQGGVLFFRGNIVSTNGNEKAEVNISFLIKDAEQAGRLAAKKLLESGGQAIADSIQHAAK